MMSLCKTVHHLLLRFPDPDDRCRSNPRPRCGAPFPSDTAGLRCVAVQLLSPPAHVVESAAVRSRTPLSTPSSSPPTSPQQGQERIDEGTRGLSYLYGGGRLELCTESLGFESCCDGRMGPEEERTEREIRRRIEEAGGRRRSAGSGPASRCGRPRQARGRPEAKQFPPPLPWLQGGGGGRSFSFLKGVRKDGRFLLTEVRVERPEIIRASRRDGRLRLELVRSEADAGEEKEQTPEAEAAVAEKVLEAEGGGEAPAAIEEEEEEGEETSEEEEVRQRAWMPAAALDRRREGGGAFRSGRCQEALREELPSPPFWGTPFVTTA